MIRFLRRLTLASALFCLAATPAAASNDDNDANRGQPSGFFYGLALGASSQVYDGADDDAILLPILGYRSANLTVFGPSVSWKAHEQGSFGVELLLSPRFDGYDESDSDVFEGMDDRESSFDIGFSIDYEVEGWVLGLTSLHDALDRSNGSELKLELARGFRAGPFQVEPALGLSYLDRDHVDYYYGVEADEVTGFRPAYEGDSALNTTLGVTLVTPAFLGGLTRINLSHTWYDSEIDDSPLTDEDSSLSLFIAFTKFFGS